MGIDATREYRPLRECTSTGSVSYGIVQPGSHVENGVPIIRVNNINDGSLDVSSPLKVDPHIDEKHRKTRLEGGELLLSLVGTTGQCVVAGEELKGWNVARAIAVIKPAQGISPEWLSICLKSPATQHYLDSRANTTVQKTLNLRDVREIPIMTVSEPEERYILEWWTTLNDKIELNRRMNATLEGMAQALFKSWFVDFDPVIDNAIKAGNPIPDELAARAEVRRQALADGTANREAAKPFPAAFQETESMGWIPEGWDAGQMSDHALIEMGQSPKGDTYNADGEGMPLVNGPVEFGPYFTNKSKWTTSPTKRSAKGDLIVCVRGSTTGRFVKSDGEYCLGRGVCSVRGKRSQCFVDQTFKSSIATMLGLTTGSTFPNWSRQTLSGFETVIPPVSIIDQFEELISPKIERIESGVLESETLTKLRDTLLPKLISGEFQNSKT